MQYFQIGRLMGKEVVRAIIAQICLVLLSFIMFPISVQLSVLFCHTLYTRVYLHNIYSIHSTQLSVIRYVIIYVWCEGKTSHATPFVFTVTNVMRNGSFPFRLLVMHSVISCFVNKLKFILNVYYLNYWRDGSGIIHACM